MARNERQQRWRDSNGKQRIEVYLPVAAVSALDALEGSRAEAIQTLLQSQHSAATEPVKPYTLRKPKADDEKRYAWIADTAAGERIALSADPARFHKWSGRYLTGSLFSRTYKAESRAAVVERLLASPEVYR